ncbi:MAG: hypothetical protein ACLFVR_15715, partial [Thiohalospira sp.]
DDDTTYESYIEITDGETIETSNTKTITTEQAYEAPVIDSFDLTNQDIDSFDVDYQISTGSEGNVEARIYYKKQSDNTYQEIINNNLGSGSYTETITGLDDDTTYESYIEITDGETIQTSNTKTITTNQDLNPPTGSISSSFPEIKTTENFNLNINNYFQNYDQVMIKDQDENVIINENIPSNPGDATLDTHIENQEPKYELRLYLEDGDAKLEYKPLKFEEHQRSFNIEVSNNDGSIDDNFTLELIKGDVIITTPNFNLNPEYQLNFTDFLNTNYYNRYFNNATLSVLNQTINVEKDRNTREDIETNDFRFTLENQQGNTRFDFLNKQNIYGNVYIDNINIDNQDNLSNIARLEKDYPIINEYFTKSRLTELDGYNTFEILRVNNETKDIIISTNGYIAILDEDLNKKESISSRNFNYTEVELYDDKIITTNNQKDLTIYDYDFNIIETTNYGGTNTETTLSVNTQTGDILTQTKPDEVSIYNQDLELLNNFSISGEVFISEYDPVNNGFYFSDLFDVYYTKEPYNDAKSVYDAQRIERATINKKTGELLGGSGSNMNIINLVPRFNQESFYVENEFLPGTAQIIDLYHNPHNDLLHAFSNYFILSEQRLLTLKEYYEEENYFVPANTILDIGFNEDDIITSQTGFGIYVYEQVEPTGFQWLNSEYVTNPISFNNKETINISDLHTGELQDLRFTFNNDVFTIEEDGEEERFENQERELRIYKNQSGFYLDATNLIRTSNETFTIRANPEIDNEKLDIILNYKRPDIVPIKNIPDINLNISEAFELDLTQYFEENEINQDVFRFNFKIGNEEVINISNNDFVPETNEFLTAQWATNTTLRLTAERGFDTEDDDNFAYISYDDENNQRQEFRLTSGAINDGFIISNLERLENVFPDSDELSTGEKILWTLSFMLVITAVIGFATATTTGINNGVLYLLLFINTLIFLYFASIGYISGWIVVLIIILTITYLTLPFLKFPQ